ncbi:potassium channel family protein [Streptomyces sodiiphilus]|uniref:Potassium channel family protein n=1 Tax=Streptomyces sodiiphilus TaxID=226217 RepID=A0ABN2NVG6_9ACTN
MSRDAIPAPAPPPAWAPPRNASERWERRSQGPLLALALLFGVAYAVPIVLPEAGPVVRNTCQAVEWGVWAAFALDYGIRLYLAERRWAFIRGHPFALAAVVLPLLQPLRLLRLVSALLLAGHRARLASQVRVTVYVAGSCAGLLMFGSLAVLEVERSAPDSGIHNLGDAVWWAFTTMTTVGYGDTAPTTGLGRVLAVALMLSGIALLGVVTANIAAWFIARFEREEADAELQRAALVELTAEVRLLRAEVQRLSGTGDQADAPAPAPGAKPSTSG